MITDHLNFAKLRWAGRSRPAVALVLAAEGAGSKATKKISGAQPFTAFQAAIDSLLETAEPSVVEEHSRQ